MFLTFFLYVISVVSMYEEHQKLLKEHDGKRQAENGWRQKTEISFWDLVLWKPFLNVRLFFLKQ